MGNQLGKEGRMHPVLLQGKIGQSERLTQDCLYLLTAA